jgi:putative ABC transport system permease protein
LKKDLPQIETAFRLFKTENRLVSDAGEKKFYEKNFFYADPEVLQILHLPLIAGNSQEALARPATVVISETVARKYFGATNPVGKTLIIAGRAFQRDVTTDASNAFLINEAGLKAFGWTVPAEALGKRIQTGFEGRQGEIVGVYKNFNFRSLQYEVEPLVLAIHSPWFFYLTLKINSADVPATLAFVREQWGRFFPQNPFEYFFLNDDFDQQYRADEKMATILLVFTGLAIGVACLGLFGLVAFVTVQRTKEIGIRKTLGATIGSIVLLLTRDFLLLVALAAVISMPITYLVLSRWLEGFAHRIALGPGIFSISAVLAATIALFTVSFHAIRAARANPVEALRYE